MNTEILNVTDIYKPISHRKINVRKLSQIKFLMIHHTGSKNLSLAALHSLHTKDLHKWPMIGYHFYITKSKIIYQLAQLTHVVNGCKDHNTNTIHVCFEGDYQNEIAPSYAVKFINIILNYLKSYHLTLEVLVHQDRRNTLCCGANLIKVINDNFKNNNAKQHLIWPEFEN